MPRCYNTSVPDDTILRAISAQINAAITQLEGDDGPAYARFVASVCALLVSTLPNVTRYDLYEIMDVGVSIARSLPKDNDWVC
jgi:hypothetical protein